MPEILEREGKELPMFAAVLAIYDISLKMIICALESIIKLGQFQGLMVLMVLT